MLNLLLTFAFAFIVGFIFDKAKVIGGMMIGAIIGSALFNILSGQGFMPSEAKFLSQVIAGTFIGCSISKKDLSSLKTIYKPVIFVITMFLVLNLTCGILIYNFSSLDAPTAFMSSTPGGMSDIPIISIDFGANPTTVAAMQFMRLVAGIGVFPTIIKQFEVNDNSSNIVVENKASVKQKSDKNNIYMLCVFCVSILGGIFGKYSTLSGGILVFSMLASLGFKLKFDNIVLPRKFRKFAQVLSGSFIGCTMTLADILSFRTLVIPIIILISCYFMNCLFSGYILHKKFGFDLREGMLACSPAGASDMALISQDMGITSPRLVVIHVVRLITVVAIFPPILQIILQNFF